MQTVIAVPQMGSDLFRRYMKRKYVASLRKVGAEVHWLDLAQIDGAVREACACDGLLLPGGQDIDPALYGQVPSESCGVPNVIRDQTEPVILRAFLETGKPVLCICRGMQLLNVYFGGTLFQDIASRQTWKHADFPHRSRGIHPVTVYEDSKLYAILRARELWVNSLHHQAVDAVGEGLRVCAVSGDGFIEGLELSDHPFCLGVQWHPEHMTARSETQGRIFHAFVDACERKTAQRTALPAGADRHKQKEGKE